jgi:hypothetical protein
MRQQVDRLADIRATMKLLRDEARAIRKGVLSGDLPTLGDDYIASVRRQIILKPVADREKPVASNGVRHTPMEHPMWENG